jgi:hypothetical protein
LAIMLFAVQQGDDADAPLDNDALAVVLRLPSKTSSLDASRSRRSLIWGTRNGQRPAPWYMLLQLTRTEQARFPVRR